MNGHVVPPQAGGQSVPYVPHMQQSAQSANASKESGSQQVWISSLPNDITSCCVSVVPMLELPDFVINFCLLFHPHHIST